MSTKYEQELQRNRDLTLLVQSILILNQKVDLLMVKAKVKLPEENESSIEGA